MPISQIRAGTFTARKSFQELPDPRAPDYQELARRRASVGWTLSLIMLVIYFGCILVVAYAPKFLGIPLGTGVTPIGIPIGLFVIVSAFVLTGIYVGKANSKYDPLIRRIVERS